MTDFKISFVQVFEDKDKALRALGSATTALPEHSHKLLDHCQQVQLRTVATDGEKWQVIGNADDKPVYMIISVAPD